MAPAIGIGIGAMCTAMLRLPLTSTLLATLLLGADGVSTTPEVVVAVAVAYVVTIILPVGPGTDRGPARGAGSTLRGRDPAPSYVMLSRPSIIKRPPTSMPVAAPIAGPAATTRSRSAANRVVASPGLRA